MAEHRRYQNISVQPLSVPRSAKPEFELPRETLSEAELLRKSTSDRSKRRVAHHAWFPLPVIRQPTLPAKEKKKNQKKQKEKKNVLLKGIVKSCKKRQIKETVAVDSKVVHKLSNSVDGGKRKTNDLLDSQDVSKIKQKKVKVDKSKNKGPSLQEVGDRKRKTEHHDDKDIPKKSKKKSRWTNLKRKIHLKF